MAEHAERSGAIRDSAREVRRRASLERVNERLEQSLASHPLLRHLLDLGVIAKALAVAIVLTLLVAVVFSPPLAAVVLVLSFFGGWYALANRTYAKRRPTREAAEEE